MYIICKGTDARDMSVDHLLIVTSESAVLTGLQIFFKCWSSLPYIVEELQLQEFST